MIDLLMPFTRRRRATPKPVSLWTPGERVALAVRLGAERLPKEIGVALLTLIEPASLAGMVGVLTVWAGSHFFGVGELADVILMTIGYLAMGGIAIEAASEMFKFATKSVQAHSHKEVEEAGQHLANGVSLIGVQAILALLMRRPNVFKEPFKKMSPLPAFGKMPMLTRQAGRIFYKPKITFTKSRQAGAGGTNIAGDVTVGTMNPGNAKLAAMEIRITVYHEAVHRFLTPRLQIFRAFRVYLKQSAYRKSYILRYLEEALAEAYGQLKAYGLSKDAFIQGLKFPLANDYQITIAKLGAEAKGILMGPITIGGMVFQVFEGEKDEVYEKADDLDL